MNKKKAIGLGIGCAGIMVIACVILAAILFIWWNTKPTGEAVPLLRELEDISVKIVSPLNVQVDDQFDLEFIISNTSDKPQELDSIDIYTSYLDSMKVNQTSPEFINYRRIELGKPYDTYAFMRIIPANSSITVKFHLTAIEPGDYTDMVYICVNSPTLCDIYEIRTIVNEN